MMASWGHRLRAGWGSRGDPGELPREQVGCDWTEGMKCRSQSCYPLLDGTQGK